MKSSTDEVEPTDHQINVPTEQKSSGDGLKVKNDSHFMKQNSHEEIITTL